MSRKIPSPQEQLSESLKVLVPVLVLFILALVIGSLEFAEWANAVLAKIPPLIHGDQNH